MVSACLWFSTLRFIFCVSPLLTLLRFLSYDALLLYNPQYSHMPVLPAGIEFTVPELEFEEDITEVAPGEKK